MAVTFVGKITDGADSDGNSTATTASVTPTANKLYLLLVDSRTGISAEPNEPTVSGAGLTWVAINRAYYDTTSASRKKMTLFRALGASPSSGALSIDFGGQNQTNVAWLLDEVDGMDTSGTNGSGAIVQSQINTSGGSTVTTITVTLGAFSSASNATYGVFANDGSAGFTSVGAGFSLVSDSDPASGVAHHISESRVDNDTTVDATYTSVGLMGAIAVEIKAATTTVVKDLIMSGIIPFAR